VSARWQAGHLSLTLVDEVSARRQAGHFSLTVVDEISARWQASRFSLTVVDDEMSAKWQAGHFPLKVVDEVSARWQASCWLFPAGWTRVTYPGCHAETADCPAVSCDIKIIILMQILHRIRRVINV